MSWQDVLKESVPYEKPSFKKAEEKLFQLRHLIIPQDIQMLEFMNRQGFRNPKLTRQKLESALQKVQRARTELEEIKKEAKENETVDDVFDELLDDVFEYSDSEYATDRGFEMLMNNEIDGVRLGFGGNIVRGIKQYSQLFEGKL